LKFPGLWISYLFLLLIIGLLVLGEPFSLGNILLLVLTLGVLIIAHLALHSFTFNLYIDNDSIRYTYFPIIREVRIIEWDQVDRIRIVQYNALRLYLGWGIRRNRKLGKAFTTDGNIG